MRITSDVDIPAELVAAQESGELVLFVGAGVSMGEPSSLPSFRDLAKDLAKAAHVRFDGRLGLDRFLGTMPKDFDTHRHAHRLVARPGSEPNTSHAAIVRLAVTRGPAKIVTTNFDQHLEAAAKAAGITTGDVWTAPAKPIGADFTGIVHLHGSLSKPAEQLVLTDRDFGQAYLTEAWATRFLQRMFDNFSVLFVGYSHDDPIMRYLALGLPSQSRRYVLTEKAEDPKWAQLGITPVAYPAVDDDHSALTAALAAWAEHSGMGKVEHRQKVQAIIGRGTPLNDVDQDYLRLRIVEQDGALDFVNAARTPEWLRWIEGESIFQGLFTGATDTDVSRVLAHWYAATFASKAEHQAAALGTLQRLGTRLPTSFHDLLSLLAVDLEAADPAAGRRWKILLATSIDGASTPPDLSAMLPYEPPVEGLDLALLRRALQPYLALAPAWSFRDISESTMPRAEPAWHVHEQLLTKNLKKLVEVRPAGDLPLGAVLEEAMSQLYELVTAYEGDDARESFAFRRPAIEPHPQNQLRGPLDALIDGLRDFGAKAAIVDPELPYRWWARGSSLFRRLSLHLMAGSAAPPDEKLQWLLDQDVLYAYPLKHEVFALLAVTAPGASSQVRAVLLEEVLKGPTFPNDVPEADRHRAYSVYNLLTWISDAAPDWELAAEELKQLQAQRPSFAARANPDFDSWSSGIMVGERPPLTAEDLAFAIDASPHEALRTLLGHDYSGSRFDGPTWRGALDVVGLVAAQRADRGAKLWEAANEVDDPEKRSDLLNALILGWADGDLGAHGDVVLSLVRGQAAFEVSAEAIGDLLGSQIEKSIDLPESSSIDAMRHIARELWSQNHGSFRPWPDVPPDSLALNTWPGKLSHYWVGEIERRRKATGPLWTGMNTVEKSALKDLLLVSEPEFAATQPALARQVAFLFDVDRDFAVEHIFPLFEGAASGPAWNAYLYIPRCDNSMLKAGFLKLVDAQWDRLESVKDRGLQQQFIELVASIVNTAQITAAQRRRLTTHAVLADDGEHAAAFAGANLQYFQDSTAQARKLWDQWAARHLKERLLGLPRNAGPGEIERWVDLIPLLGERLSAGLELIGNMSVGLGESFTPPTWSEDTLAQHGGALVEHYAGRIRASTPGGWGATYAVRELVSDLAEALDEQRVAPLVQAASDAGFPLRLT